MADSTKPRGAGWVFFLELLQHIPPTDFGIMREPHQDDALKEWKKQTEQPKEVVAKSPSLGEKEKIKQKLTRMLSSHADSGKYDPYDRSWVQNLVNRMRRAPVTGRAHILYKMFIPFMHIIIQMSRGKLQKYIDYNLKIYGLRPATQIFYKGAFGLDNLQHHGVYMGSGLVIEVGGKWCRSSDAFTDQCLSLSTLEDFLTRSQNGQIYQVDYESIDLTNMSVLREQLTRGLFIAMQPEWSYNPFTNNCQHWSSFVVTSDPSFTQCPIGGLKTKTTPIDLKKSKACARLPCQIRNLTKKGKTCFSKTHSGVRGKYCYLDEASTEWDWVDEKKKYVCWDGKKSKSCIPQDGST